MRNSTLIFEMPSGRLVAASPRLRHSDPSDTTVTRDYLVLRVTLKFGFRVRFITFSLVEFFRFAYEAASPGEAFYSLSAADINFLVYGHPEHHLS